jgi:hypothetical protein
VSQEVVRVSLREYPSIQHGAVVVAGPDRDEPNEERVATPKHILAERLQASAERASNEDGNDEIFGSKPGAISVPGPDADDGRHVNRVITPKRMLAERLHHASEFVDNTTSDEIGDVVEGNNEVTCTNGPPAARIESSERHEQDDDDVVENSKNSWGRLFGRDATMSLDVHRSHSR